MGPSGLTASIRQISGSGDDDVQLQIFDLEQGLMAQTVLQARAHGLDGNKTIELQASALQLMQVWRSAAEIEVLLASFKDSIDRESEGSNKRADLEAECEELATRLSATRSMSRDREEQLAGVLSPRALATSGTRLQALYRTFAETHLRARRLDASPQTRASEEPSAPTEPAGAHGERPDGSHMLAEENRRLRASLRRAEEEAEALRRELESQRREMEERRDRWAEQRGEREEGEDASDAATLAILEGQLQRGIGTLAEAAAAVAEFHERMKGELAAATRQADSATALSAVVRARTRLLQSLSASKAGARPALDLSPIPQPVFLTPPPAGPQWDEGPSLGERERGGESGRGGGGGGGTELESALFGSDEEGLREGEVGDAPGVTGARGAGELEAEVHVLRAALAAARGEIEGLRREREGKGGGGEGTGRGVGGVEEGECASDGERWKRGEGGDLQLVARLTEAEAAWEEAHGELERVREEVESVKREREDVMEELERVKRERDEGVRELERVRKEREQVVKEQERVVGEHKEEVKELERLREERGVEANALERAREERADVETKAGEAAQRREAEEKREQHAREKRREIESERNALAKEIEGMQEEFMALVEHRNALSREVEALGARKDEERARQEEAAEDLQAVKEKTGEAEKRAREAEERREEAEKRAQEAEGRREEAEKRAQEAEERREEAEKRAQEAEDHATELIKEVRGVSAQLDELKSQIREREARLVELDKEVVKGQEAMEQLRDRAKEMQESIAVLEKRQREAEEQAAAAEEARQEALRALADAEERAAEAEREYQTLEASGLSVERATHEDGEVTTGRRGERGGETEEETQRRAVAVRETAEKAEMESRVVDEEAQRRTAAAREIAEQAEAEARDLEDRRDRIRAAIEKLEEEAQRARREAASAREEQRSAAEAAARLRERVRELQGEVEARLRALHRASALEGRGGERWRGGEGPEEEGRWRHLAEQRGQALQRAQEEIEEMRREAERAERELGEMRREAERAERELGEMRREAERLRHLLSRAPGGSGTGVGEGQHGGDAIHGFEEGATPREDPAWEGIRNGEHDAARDEWAVMVRRGAAGARGGVAHTGSSRGAAARDGRGRGSLAHESRGPWELEGRTEAREGIGRGGMRGGWGGPAAETEEDRVGEGLEGEALSGRSERGATMREGGVKWGEGLGMPRAGRGAGTERRKVWQRGVWEVEEEVGTVRELQRGLPWDREVADGERAVAEWVGQARRARSGLREAMVEARDAKGRVDKLIPTAKADTERVGARKGGWRRGKQRETEEARAEVMRLVESLEGRVREMGSGARQVEQFERDGGGAGGIGADEGAEVASATVAVGTGGGTGEGSASDRDVDGCGRGHEGDRGEQRRESHDGRVRDGDQREEDNGRVDDGRVRDEDRGGKNREGCGGFEGRGESTSHEEEAGNEKENDRDGKTPHSKQMVGENGQGEKCITCTDVMARSNEPVGGARRGERREKMERGDAESRYHEKGGNEMGDTRVWGSKAGKREEGEEMDAGAEAWLRGMMEELTVRAKREGLTRNERRVLRLSVLVEVRDAQIAELQRRLRFLGDPLGFARAVKMGRED